MTMEETQVSGSHQYPIVRRLESQPGDGTRYTLLIIGPIHGGIECGALGAIEDGATAYVVVNGLNGLSYLFRGESNLLHWRYISEKLGCGITSAKVITKMLGDAIGRPTMCE